MYKKLLIAGVACLALIQGQQTQDFPGRYTFSAEGQEGGRYMSRVPHQPTLTSGVTIGRGYDMKERTASEVVRDLTNAGVPLETAQQLSAGAGKTGQAARTEVGNLKGIEITPEAQKNLFDSTYQSLESDVSRILTKPDVASTYGNVDPSTLPQGVKEFLTDLRYRGDFTSSSRKDLMPSLVEGQKTGDYSKFWDAAKQWNDNSNVPQDRKTTRDQLINDRSQAAPSTDNNNNQNNTDKDKDTSNQSTENQDSDKDKDTSTQTSENQDSDKDKDGAQVTPVNYNGEDQFFAIGSDIDGEGVIEVDDGFLPFLPGGFYSAMIF